jgi:hypothetical protein
MAQWQLSARGAALMRTAHLIGPADEPLVIYQQERLGRASQPLRDAKGLSSSGDIEAE